MVPTGGQSWQVWRGTAGERAMSIRIEPLAGVGAEISGIDIATLSDADFAAIRAAFADHGLIFFRDQSID